MPIHYEWLVEEIDEHGDITESNHYDSAESVFKYYTPDQLCKENCAFGVVRDNFDAYGELKERSWAYAERGENGALILPEIDDGGHKLPKRFAIELSLASDEQR